MAKDKGNLARRDRLQPFASDQRARRAGGGGAAEEVEHDARALQLRAEGLGAQPREVRRRQAAPQRVR